MEIKRTTILGLNTRYLETNSSDTKQTLIILHGWGSKIESWKQIVRFLEKAGYKVFVPDLPGFGETDEPKTPWQIGDYINFLEELLKNLNIKNFVLAGHSFGGQIAIAYGSQENNRANALVLMAAARVTKRESLKAKIFYLLSSAGNLPFKIPPFSMTKPFAQKVLYKIIREKDYYKSSPRMRETMKLIQNEVVGDRAERIKMPTLILWGEQDTVTPYPDAGILNEKIAGSKLITFPNIGHGINLEKTEEVAQKINQFMKTLPL